ncbi:MAG: hypothetical protein KC561_06105 [Myxococcales bacterium]|nr:hypothetical protein [Myxococcales bacterium]
MSDPAPKPSKALFLACLLLTVAIAAPALVLYPMPSQDGHQHALTAFVYGRISDPALNFSSYFRTHFPATSQGYVLLTVGLDMLLPFAAAERLALALVCALLPATTGVFAYRTGRHPLVAVAMAGLAVHSWPLAMGFYNFLLAFGFVPLVVLAASRALRLGRVRNWAVLAALLLGLAWLHIAVAAFAGLAVLWLALTSSPTQSTRSRAVTVLVAIVAGLPSALYAVWVALYHGRPLATLGAVVEAVEFQAWPTRLSDMFWAGPGAWSSLSGWLLVACTAGIVISVFRSKADRVHTALVVLGMLTLVLYLLVPFHLPNWSFVSPRLIFAASALFALVGLSRVSRKLWVAILSLGCICGLATTSLAEQRIHADLADRVSAITYMPRAMGSPFLPIDMGAATDLSETNPSQRRHPRYVDFTQHLSARNAVERGGVFPYVFATNPAIHSIVYLRAPEAMVGPAPGVFSRRGWRCGDDEPRDCIARRNVLVDRLAMFGLIWQQLLIQDIPEQMVFRLRERGYRLAFEYAGASLWFPQPSTVTLQIHWIGDGEGGMPPAGAQTAPLPVPLIVEIGYPGLSPVYSRRYPAGETLPQPLVLGPMQLLAGGVRVVIFLDQNDDATWQSSEPGGRTTEVIRARSDQQIPVFMTW